MQFYFVTAPVRNPVIQAHLAVTTFRLRAQKWWRAQVQARPELVITYDQLREWIKTELVPKADPRSTSAAWRQLRFTGNVQEYIDQLEALKEHFPLMKDPLLDLSTAPLGEEARAVIYRADAMYGASGITHNKLCTLIKDYLNSLTQAQRTQLAEHPPLGQGYGITAAKPKPKLSAPSPATSTSFAPAQERRREPERFRPQPILESRPPRPFVERPRPQFAATMVAPPYPPYPYPAFFAAERPAGRPASKTKPAQQRQSVDLLGDVIPPTRPLLAPAFRPPVPVTYTEEYYPQGTGPRQEPWPMRRYGEGLTRAGAAALPRTRVLCARYARMGNALSVGLWGTCPKIAANGTIPCLVILIGLGCRQTTWQSSIPRSLHHLLKFLNRSWISRCRSRRPNQHFTTPNVAPHHAAPRQLCLMTCLAQQRVSLPLLKSPKRIHSHHQ